MGRLQKGVNDLESWCLNNGLRGKQLMSEWTGECNDGKHYKIDEVSRGSNKKFKWVCSKGHEWHATNHDRTSNNSGCPYCSGNRVSDGNNLETWCMNNDSFGKQLLSEWTGECTDGKHYKIDEVSYGSSHKKFKWKCSKGHEWSTTISHRTKDKTGCPDCFIENSLKSWCLSNGVFGEQLKSEWTGECIDSNHYEIDEISYGNSTKKFKWICSKGHEWLTTVAARTGHKTGCPYCSQENHGKLIAKAKLSEENSLKSWCLANGSFGKQLLGEWTGLCKDDQRYAIDQVSFGSNKKFRWICSKDHEWFAAVASRTNAKTGCPYCYNINRSEIYTKASLSDENSLKTWCMNNGSFGKQLISEWTGECDDGKHYRIDEVSFGSNKKFKWKCSKDHEWFAVIANRTYSKSSCTYCSNIGTSYPEQFIYHSLKQVYSNAENRCRVLKSSQNPQGIEFDVGVPDIPLCIEYSPTYWHEGREERDQYKKDLCQKSNVRLIQIVEDSYDEMPFKMEADYICFKMDENKKDEILEAIVEHILKSLGHSISEVDLERVKQEAYENSKGIEKEIQDTD